MDEDYHYSETLADTKALHARIYERGYGVDSFKVFVMSDDPDDTLSPSGYMAFLDLELTHGASRKKRRIMIGDDIAQMMEMVGRIQRRLEQGWAFMLDEERGESDGDS